MFTLTFPSEPSFDGYRGHPGLARRHTHASGRRHPTALYEIEPELPYDIDYASMNRRPSAPASRTWGSAYQNCGYEDYDGYYRQPAAPHFGRRQSMNVFQLRGLIAQRQQQQLEEERQRQREQQRQRESERQRQIEQQRVHRQRQLARLERERAQVEKEISSAQLFASQQLASMFSAPDQQLHRQNAIRRKSEDERLAELEVERTRLLAKKAEREAQEAAETQRAQAIAEQERQAKIQKMKLVRERHEAERLAQAAAAGAQAPDEPETAEDFEQQRRNAQRLVVETFLGELLGRFIDFNDSTPDVPATTSTSVDVKGKGKAPEQPQPEVQPKQERKVRFRGEYAGPSYSQQEEAPPAPVQVAIPIPTPVPVEVPVIVETVPAPAVPIVADLDSPAMHVDVPPVEPIVSEPTRSESPARDLALQQVQLLLAKFESLTYAFAFPRVLTFAFLDTPELAYTAQNAPIHSYEHALNSLLQELDGIDSEGDKEVRRARRESVRKVEKELGWVEAEIRRAWERENLQEELLSSSESEVEAIEPIEQSVVEPTPAEVEITNGATQSITEPVSETVEPALTHADDRASTKALLNEFLTEDTVTAQVPGAGINDEPVVTTTTEETDKEATVEKTVEEPTAESDPVAAEPATEQAPLIEVAVDERGIGDHVVEHLAIEEPNVVKSVEIADTPESAIVDHHDDATIMTTEQFTAEPTNESTLVIPSVESSAGLVADSVGEPVLVKTEPRALQLAESATTPGVEEDHAPSTVGVVPLSEPVSENASPLLSRAFVPVPISDELSHKVQFEDEVLAQSSSPDIESSGKEEGKSDDEFELI
ncbi:hypothetical protein DACRYDRAFT_100904 [Dacryopinax primogenitus]|uniref:BAG domain-containing protein n=1 Tax=Dacryopinax primogenitus (strain DJM 731) TaxID=1858805 RepID=M5FSD2_DACPD|nr:uncharacterized protein DACRYDRAFT_100904 [Dacryopinax primogenitus]EJU00316.1 hypothetical protein DACRYDRAFT_100904 [Dacryopinax primogenitus]